MRNWKSQKNRQKIFNAYSKSYLALTVPKNKNKNKAKMNVYIIKLKSYLKMSL